MKAKKVSISTSSNTHAGIANGYILESGCTSIMLDPPSVIIDSNIDINGIRNKDYVEIEVIKEYPSNLSGIFITNSKSLSVFFIDSNVPIYLTDVIYLQMKERLKYYVSLGPVSREKKMPQAHTKIVRVSEYKKIEKRVKLIKYNQIIEFTYLSVIPQPAGISLGWIAYKIVQGRECLCVYAYGVPGRCSLAQEMKEQNCQVPLIVNRLVERNKPGIQELTKDILAMDRRDRSFVITMDVLNHSMEISLHVLSILKGTKILVSHSGFKKIRQMYEMKKEVFSNKFMLDPSVISTLFSTVRLQPSSPRDVYRISEKEKVVIFCDLSHYSFFYRKMDALHLKDYSVRFMGDREDALSLRWVSKLFTDEGTAQTPTDRHVEIASIPEDTYEGIGEDALHRIKICNTENIHRMAETNGKYSFHFTGKLTEELSGIILKCKEPVLEHIINTQKAVKYIVGDSVLYRIKDKVFKITEDHGLVHIEGNSIIPTEK